MLTSRAADESEAAVTLTATALPARRSMPTGTLPVATTIPPRWDTHRWRVTGPIHPGWEDDSAAAAAPRPVHDDDRADLLGIATASWTPAPPPTAHRRASGWSDRRPGGICDHTRHRRARWPFRCGADKPCRSCAFRQRLVTARYSQVRMEARPSKPASACQAASSAPCSASSASWAEPSIRVAQRPQLPLVRADELAECVLVPGLGRLDQVCGHPGILAHPYARRQGLAPKAAPHPGP